MVASSSPDDQNIVFFDGVCNLCNFWIQLLLDQDKKKVLKFCSLQNHFSKTFLGDKHPDSIIYWRKGQILYKSKAVLAILSDLGGIWRVLCLFKIIPGFILDKIYDFIARRRYSWFGQREICRVPTDEEKSRFLE